jgi:hypothetical protein
MKQQSDARRTEVFIPMRPTEIEAFAVRQERIYQIHVLLNEHSATLLSEHAKR